MSESQRLFGLPQLPGDIFNRVAQKLYPKKTPRWRDTNQDGKISPREIMNGNHHGYVVKNHHGHLDFTPRFTNVYRHIAQTYRRELIARELELTIVKPMHTDFGAWLDQTPPSVDVTAAEKIHYQRGMAALLQAAPIVQSMYDRQIGYTTNLKKEVPTDDPSRTLLDRYRQPWCVANYSLFCSALESMPDYSNGMIMGGMTCKEVGENINGLANPFTVTNQDDNLIPNSLYFKEEHVKVAQFLRTAASEFDKIPREKFLAKYLKAVVQALQSKKLFPFDESDKAWMEHDGSDSILFVRIGPDETNGSPIGRGCETKAHYHMTVALKNFASAHMTEQYKPFLQRWEKASAKMINNPEVYREQPVVVKMPGFFDVIVAVGDDIGGPRGTVVGQTLPNWCGTDGKLEPCPRRTMIWVNKQLKLSSPELLEKYLFPLIDPKDRPYYDPRVGVNKTVLHELSHNLGPYPAKTKPGSGRLIKDDLKSWSATFEEFKAEILAFYATTDLLLEARQKATAGKLSPEELEKIETGFKQHCVSELTYALGMLTRATRKEKFEGGAYAKFSAVVLGYFREKEAYRFDHKNGWWSIDYDRALIAARELTQKVLRLYAQGTEEEAGAFMQFYTQGPGYRLIERHRLQEVAGKRPSTMFDYQVTGL